jgi:hypothetical protein
MVSKCSLFLVSSVPTPPSLAEHLHDGGGHAHDLQVLVGSLRQTVLGHGQLLTNGLLLAVREVRQLLDTK